MAATVDDLVGRLIPSLGALEGEPVALSGGMTNRNVLVTLGGDRYVVRCPSKETAALGIDRAAEHQATEAASAAGIGPEVAAFVPEEGCLVTRFVQGRELTATDLRDDAVVNDVARALRAFHDGPALPVRFDTLEIADSYRATTLARGGEVPDSYARARGVAERILTALRDQPEHSPVPCHNDLLAANFLHDGERVWIIDWEYAGMGDRYFDLANLAVNNEFGEADERRLLAFYWGEEPVARRLAALRLMRLVSDLREAMWGVVQSVLSPDAGLDFGAYASKHFARMLDAAAEPGLDDLIVQARGAA